MFEESVKLFRSISGDSPAASGKVIRLCQAVRLSGGNVWVISLGRGRQKGSWKWYPSVVRRSEGVPIIYTAYFDAPLLTHFITTLSLFLILLRITNRNSVLIFYNFLIYYAPALVINRLCGRRCVLDLEDGFRSDERTIKRFLNHFLLGLHNMLCNGGAMVASSSLITQTTLRPNYVCYGVAPSVQFHKDWCALPLQVIFGGALLHDTGVELFLQTLEMLVFERSNITTRLKFIVTGFGDLSGQIKEFVETRYKDFVEFRGNISSLEYREILNQSHIGLCLKLPDRSMGATTFPSKVVEMAAYGLLVVSTNVSDVPNVLSDDSAVLLREAEPLALAQALKYISSNPTFARETAKKGQMRVATLLSAKKVGTELLRFWNGIDTL